MAEHACTPFGANEEPAANPDVGAADGEAPTSGREPPKTPDTLDASTYDGPVLDGAAVDSGFCTSNRGPEMVELAINGARFCIDSTEVTVAQYRVFLNALDDGHVPDKPAIVCDFNTAATSSTTTTTRPAGRPTRRTGAHARSRAASAAARTDASSVFADAQGAICWQVGKNCFATEFALSAVHI